MDSMKSKVSYLQGMVDGLSIDLNSKEGKIISAMLKVMDEMAEKMDEIEYRQDHMEMYISTLDDDLQYVEEEFYGIDDTEDYLSEDNFVEHQCPRCGEMIYIDKAIIENNEEIGCPNCSYDLIGNINEGTND